MFGKKLLFAVAVLAGILFFGSAAANAQVSAQNVLKRVSAITDKLETQKAQILFIQVDNIEKDKISTQTYTLEAGSNYAIVTLGDDERIQDIDLVVADSNGDVVGKDTDDANVAIVKFAAKKTQSFKIGVKGYKMSKDDGFYGIIIARLD